MRLFFCTFLIFGHVFSFTVDRAQADSFSFSNGMRAATLDAVIEGGNLKMTLTNTSIFDTFVPVDVLTAVYFDIDGSPALTPVSANVSPGSFSIYDTQLPTAESNGGDVGGEWAYRGGISGGTLPDSQSYGISSTGVGVFGTGQGTLFGTENLAGPANVNGLQYGLVSAGDDPITGNGGLKNSGGLVHNAVEFFLSGIGPGFSLDLIKNVRFQYGTSLTEPSFQGNKDPDSATPAVPEPSTVTLLGIALFSLAGYRWKTRRGTSTKKQS